MTNPRDVKYANERIARWQDRLKQRSLMATSNISFACLRGFRHELRARLPLADIATVGNHLPAVQRGVFYEDWRPAAPLPTPDLATFEAALTARLLPHIHMPKGLAADVLCVPLEKERIITAQSPKAIALFVENILKQLPPPTSLKEINHG